MLDLVMLLRLLKWIGCWQKDDRMLIGSCDSSVTGSGNSKKMKISKLVLMCRNVRDSYAKFYNRSMPPRWQAVLLTHNVSFCSVGETLFLAK